MNDKDLDVCRICTKEFEHLRMDTRRLQSELKADDPFNRSRRHPPLSKRNPTM